VADLPNVDGAVEGYFLAGVALGLCWPVGSDGSTGGFRAKMADEVRKMIGADLRGHRARRSKGSRLLQVDDGCQSVSAMSDVYESKTFNQKM
jgi:hypothetical protein